MVCYYCKSKTSVINSRYQKRKNTVWRRRQCLNCRSILTSSEQYDIEKILLVNKSNKTDYFDKYRLFLSIYSCLSHRENPTKDAGYITNNVIDSLASQQKSVIIDSKTIRSIIVISLSRFDTLAANQYSIKHP